MDFEWKHNRCIICLSVGELTVEHVIPKSIGGRLRSKLLCKSCNSRLGHEIDPQLRNDPGVILAVQSNGHMYPKISSRIKERAPHIAHGPGGKVTGWINDGTFNVAEQKLSDGSLVAPTMKAINRLKTLMSKDGNSDLQIERAIERFVAAQDDEFVQVNRGMRAVKWSITRIQPDLSKAKPVSDTAVLKIAFEFMAGIIGSAIFEDHPNLQALRNILNDSNSGAKSVYGVERLTSKTSQNIHGICFEGNMPCANFQVRLFGTIAFRVQLLQIAVHHPMLVYTHNLETGEERVSSPEQK